MVEEDGGGFLARAADDFKVESLRFDSLFKSIRYYYLYAFYLCTWHGRVVRPEEIKTVNVVFTFSSSY